MLLFIPVAIICVGIAVIAFTDWRGSANLWMISGAACYLIASFVSTIVFNVPMNDALAKVGGNGSAAADLWNVYLRDWTWWNHVGGAAVLQDEAAVGEIVAIDLGAGLFFGELVAAPALPEALLEHFHRRR